MLGQILQGIRLVHIGLAVLAAIGFFAFFARTRFWIPLYVHLLAIFGLGVGAWLAVNVRNDAPISRFGPWGKFLLALAPPAMVYLFFVFHGGQRAAFTRRFQMTVPCPYCKGPVKALPSGDEAPSKSHHFQDQQCPHCGQTLAG
jgi:hypothetical protein